MGYNFVRNSVSEYIKKRDCLTAGPDTLDLILLDGASQGVHILLQTLIGNSREGVMIPIPQYPLYTAALALQQGQEIHYFLEEEKGWSINIEHL